MGKLCDVVCIFKDHAGCWLEKDQKGPEWRACWMASLVLQAKAAGGCRRRVDVRQAWDAG